MGWLSKGVLGAAFLLATDLAIAATTGVTGLHGIVVDAGAQFGEAVGIPQVDWHELVGLEPVHDHGAHMDNTDIAAADTGADTHDHHDHAHDASPSEGDCFIDADGFLQCPA